MFCARRTKCYSPLYEEYLALCLCLHVFVIINFKLGLLFKNNHCITSVRLPLTCYNCRLFAKDFIMFFHMIYVANFNTCLFLSLQEGFVEFYEGGPERRNESPWPSFKTICSYAAGAIGVLTLGAILSQKS